MTTSRTTANPLKVYLAGGVPGDQVVSPAEDWSPPAEPPPNDQQSYKRLARHKPRDAFTSHPASPAFRSPPS